MNTRQYVRLVVAFAIVVMFMGLVACSSAPISKSDKEQQQDSVRDMANQRRCPSCTRSTRPQKQPLITKAAGYAVFSDFGFKVWTLGRGPRQGGGGRQMR